MWRQFQCESVVAIGNVDTAGITRNTRKIDPDMDNRYPRASRANWSPSDRQPTDMRSRRVALVVSTLLICLLVSRDLVADPIELGPIELGPIELDPIELADDRALPMTIRVPLDSVKLYAPYEVTDYPPVVHGDALSGAPLECETYESDSNTCKPGTHGQYAEQPSQPDRWDFAGPQFPWLDFPSNCDNWRVGPVLGIRVDGLLFYRTNVASNFLTDTLGTPPLHTLQYVNRFEHAVGARAYVTSRFNGFFAMQAGYIGAADWNASAESQFADDLNPLQNETRLNGYVSSLHAIEMNVLPYSSLSTQWFLGARYVDFAEDFTQLTDRVNFDINNNNMATGLNDDLSAIKINNRLIGAHMGLRRDIWSQNRRFSLETLINGGPFSNILSRKETDQTFVTVNPPDDPETVVDESQETQVRVSETVRRRRATELAFFGEAALTGVYRFHPCLSLRAGYQAAWLYGANLASDPFGETSFVFFQGFHCGIEYRR